MNFTHLHVHSHYSILDGMSKVPDLVDKCRKTGMNALALTDHGNMYGIKEFLDYVKKVNGKPKGAVKDCEGEIKKAIGLRDKDLPKWKEELKSATTAFEKKMLQDQIKEAEAAVAKLPELEEKLPKLKEAAANYVPFRPIVGVEAYCARRGRLMHDSQYREMTGEGKSQIVDSSGWHLILLAKNSIGYHNLCRIVSLSFIEGFYNRPRIDKELLEQYHEGLIVCSACLGGELPQKIMAGKVEEAEKAAQWFKSIFGEDYYIELQRHKTDKPGGDQSTYQRQREVNPVLIDIARRNGIKIICTNDVHFVEEEHAEAHDRLICLSTGKFLDEVDRMHYTKQEWLKSPEEMAALFSDLPEALENTQEIVEKIETYDIDSDPIMPLFPIPEEFGTEEQWREKFTPEDLFNEFTRDEKGNVVLTQEEAEKKIKKLGGYDRLYRIKFEADYLAKLTWEGAHMRYGEELTQEQTDRIIFELHVMKTMGFPGYFLIVMDYIRAAREELGVSVGPGRGSAAGSVVAYCLRITDVDPLPYDLLFERFLNPDRISLPDIDVDFDDAGRAKVLKWVSQKYGETHVAHIITYGTMASKSAIADVGRVQRVPLSEVNRLKGFIPERSFPDNIKDEKGKSPKVNLKNCYKYVPELKEMLEGADDNISTMLHYAQQLEDTIRQIGVHACGVIIGADDLTKFAPLATVDDKKEGKVMVTQYDGHVVESIGLIKMDFLGLTTLTIIKEALKNIQQRTGEIVDIDHIPVDDEETYKLFARGETIGTFQFESPGMQKYLRELQPTELSDLIAMNALYRPGPMDYIPSFIARKQKKEPVTYDIPVMEKYLKDTYGITVYQEQVMLLSRLLADFTRGESDALRKAMGKKKKDIVDQMKPKFIEGGKKNGHNPEVLDKIWRDWEKFASYAFNKSHATCYAWVAYQTGYLKAHYPSEFMAANLTVVKDDITKVTKFMDECKSMGINVLEPNVNESGLNFTVNKAGDIRFGLGGIKGVGEGAVEAIIKEREGNGPYRSLFNFLERVNLSACNKKTVEAMAYAGAFDCFEDVQREQIFGLNSKGEYVLDTLMRYGNLYQADKQQQQNSLFGAFEDFATSITKPELPTVARWTTIEKLNREKELIGIYLSAHPLDDYEFEIRDMCSITTADLTYFGKWCQITRTKTDAVDRNGRPVYRSEPRTFVPEEGEPEPQEWLKKYEGRTIHFAGLITKIEERVSGKSGKPFGIFTIEDYTGSYEFRLFEDQYIQYATILRPNNFVYITAQIQNRTYASKVRYARGQKVEMPPFETSEYSCEIQRVEFLQDVQAKYFTELTLMVPSYSVTPEFNSLLIEHLEKVKQTIAAAQQTEQAQDTKHLATATLKLHIYDDGHQNDVFFTSQKYSVCMTPEFYHYLRNLKEEGITFTTNL